jgi:gamma-glutamyltranspeptidase/glutathione hydrolase
LDELARPAIQLARHGFAWAEVCHDLAAQSTQLVAAWNPDGCDYYPNGAPFATGDVVRLTHLADALEIYAARPNEFLHGEVGRAIVDAVQARGGVITLADMEHASAEWMQCVSSDVQEHRLWVTPAPTYGPTLLAAVAGAHNASTVADEYHRFIVAMRANREALADPSGTSMVSAADTLGNVVTMVHSNSYPRFGSGIVVSDYQLILNNRAGRGFTPVPGHPNFPVAGRRPATTLHAWALRSERGDYYSGATPGGANQVPWNTQTIGQIIAGVSEPGVLVTSPRWEWLPDDDGVRLEGGFTEEKLGNIEELAPRTVRSPRWATRAAQQVVRVSSARDAAIVGGADPRTVGAAVGVNVTPVVN